VVREINRGTPPWAVTGGVAITCYAVGPVEALTDWDGTAWGLVIGTVSLVLAAWAIWRAESARRAADRVRNEMASTRLVGAIGRLAMTASKLDLARRHADRELALDALRDWPGGAGEVAALVAGDRYGPTGQDLRTALSGSHAYRVLAQRELQQEGRPVIEATADFSREAERVMVNRPGFGGGSDP
jgi:hypothetical protein